MKSVCLPAIEEALAYGYGELSDPDDLYHSPQWLRMDEQIRIARPFNVVCLPDENGAHAVAATWGLVVDDTAFWPFMRVDTVLTMLLQQRKVPLTAAVEKTLSSLMPNAYLGALRGGTTRLRVDPTLPAQTAKRAAGEVLAGVEAMARAEDLRSVAFFYMPADEALLRQVLAERGYLEFGPTLSVSILRVPPTFGDYLRRFGKRRRDSIRWERRKIAAAGVQIRVEPLTTDLSREMLPLEAQLYGKYGHEEHPTEMARILHHAVIEGYGDAAPVITARADGALRAYAAFMQVNKTLYSRDVGFDYTWPQKLPLYFEVVFYAAIELAITSGARQIYYSYSSEETKVSRGCELHPRLTFVKALDRQASAGLHGIHADLARGEVAG
jgi:uncharacterized protein